MYFPPNMGVTYIHKLILWKYFLFITMCQHEYSQTTAMLTLRVKVVFSFRWPSVWRWESYGNLFVLCYKESNPGSHEYQANTLPTELFYLQMGKADK